MLLFDDVVADVDAVEKKLDDETTHSLVVGEKTHSGSVRDSTSLVPMSSVFDFIDADEEDDAFFDDPRPTLLRSNDNSIVCGVLDFEQLVVVVVLPRKVLLIKKEREREREREREKERERERERERRRGEIQIRRGE